MGLFVKNEKEKSDLETFVESVSKINTTYYDCEGEVIKEVKNYAMDVIKNNIINPFKTEDDLISVFLKYLSTHKTKTEEVGSFINQVKNVLNTIYLDGEYENINLTLKLFDLNGAYTRNLFDINLLRALDNIKYYLALTSMIIENETAKNNFDKINTFLIDIRHTFTGSESFYYYAVSFINKINYGTDIENLIQKELIRIDKKEGIYDLDEKTLDKIYEKTLSAEGFLSELESQISKAGKLTDDLKERLETHKARLLEINQSSLKEYQTSVKHDLDELRNLVEKLKGDLAAYEMEKREEILSSLIQTQRESETEIISARDKAIETLKNFESALSTIAITKTSEITKLGQSKIGELKDFLKNHSELKEIMSDVMPSKEIMNLLAAIAKNKETIIASATPNLVSAPNLVVPSPNIIIPEEIDLTINPYFDEKRSFTSRMSEIKEKMQKNHEEKGIVYHSETETIIEYIIEGLPPYLYGPSGGGKSMAVSLIADLLGINYHNIGYINEEYQVIGAEPFLNNFTPSVVHNLFKHGGLAFADELDNGNARATVILNPFLRKTTQEYTFSNRETVKRHPNFRMITAGNTDGRGATKNHSTREGIEESVFQSLKPKIYIGYDPTIEKHILKDHPEWYNFIIEFRRVQAEYLDNKDEMTLTDAVTTRDMADIKSFLDKGFSIEKIINGDFIQAKDKDYLEHIRNSLSIHYKNIKEGKEKEIYNAFEESVKKYYLKRGI